MNTSRPRVNGNGRSRFRRGHRWVGGTLVAFVLFLSLTGIALNHSSDLGLDRRYVNWSWLLDTYGLDAHKPYAGRVAFDPMVVVGDGRRVHVLMKGGDLVESLDLSSLLPGDIERVGRNAGRAILMSGDALFRSDVDITSFEPWSDGNPGVIEWSTEVQPDAAGLEALDVAWRGRGLTVERVLLDLHSGRIFAIPGRLILDIVAIGMILLSISGLILANSRRTNGRNGNGQK